MTDELQALIKMAEHDTSILELKRKLKAIPIKVAEARKQLDSEQVVLDEYQIPWDQCQQEITEKEATIQIALDTINKFEEHMERVNTQKEYMAARKQIDEARRLNSRLQNEILEARVKQEELEPPLKEIRVVYDKVKEAFEEIEGGILKVKKKLDKQIAGLEKEKAAVAATIDTRTLKYYERISNAAMVPALVEIVAGVCSGCNLALPPQVYNQVIAAQERYHVCEHCNRMIYYVPPPAEEEAEDEAAPQAKVS